MLDRRGERRLLDTARLDGRFRVRRAWRRVAIGRLRGLGTTAAASFGWRLVGPLGRGRESQEGGTAPAAGQEQLNTAQVDQHVVSDAPHAVLLARLLDKVKQFAKD